MREESALNLLSQVRPFKLECDRRAWRSMARSSPELCSSKSGCSSRFKAKPVPRNLFGTEVYDRMLEDEYYRSASPLIAHFLHILFQKNLNKHSYKHI